MFLGLFITTHYVIQSFAYVWKNEKLCDEKSVGVADEECTRGPEENDNGNAGKRPRVV